MTDTADRSPRAVIAAMRRRLERWELDHLRTLASQLQSQLEEERAEHERTRERLDRAEAWAESWHRDFMDLTQELMDAGRTVGLTRDGQIVVAKPATN